MSTGPGGYTAIRGDIGMGVVVGRREPQDDHDDGDGVEKPRAQTKESKYPYLLPLQPRASCR